MVDLWRKHGRGGDRRGEQVRRRRPGCNRAALIPSSPPPLQTGRRTTVTARTILALAAATIAPALLAACGTAGAVTELGELKSVAATCPRHSEVAAYVAWDEQRALRGRRIAAG